MRSHCTALEVFLLDKANLQQLSLFDANQPSDVMHASVHTRSELHYCNK